MGAEHGRASARRAFRWLGVALFATLVVIVLSRPRPAPTASLFPSLQGALVRQIARARRSVYHAGPMATSAAESAEAGRLLPWAANAGYLPPSRRALAFFVPYRGVFLLIPRNAPRMAATMLRALTARQWHTLGTAPSCAIRVGTNYAGEILTIFVCARAPRKR